MSLWSYLKLPEHEWVKLMKQEQASEQVDEWCRDVIDYAWGVGEAQRRFRKPTGEV